MPESQTITDPDLVRGAVQQAGSHGSYRGRQLWDILTEIFDCRPSVAVELCLRFERNPHEVPQP